MSQRTREIGVRMALGQAPSEARRSVVLQGLRIVALVACWIPARRATRVDPARALRE